MAAPRSCGARRTPRGSWLPPGGLKSQGGATRRWSAGAAALLPPQTSEGCGTWQCGPQTAALSAVWADPTSEAAGARGSGALHCTGSCRLPNLWTDYHCMRSLLCCA